MITKIPPVAMTKTSMSETAARIEMHLKQKSTLPTSLDDLPMRQGYANRTRDGWNRPLIYDAHEDGFTLASQGKDGVAGGKDDEEDIVRRYRLVDGLVEELR